MERAMSVEERIRRAEDIYNRRNGINNSGIWNSSNSFNAQKTKNKKQKRTAKRLFMQIFVCLLIYIIFYTVTNRNYIFSEEFRNSVDTFFNEKMNISGLYAKAKDYILSLFDDEYNTSENKEIENNQSENKSTKDNAEATDDVEKNSETENNEINSQANSETENNESRTEENQKNQEQGEQSKEENIGGAEEKTENAQNVDEKKEESISQTNEEKFTEQQLMEKDAKEIKKKISFIAPIKGRISSTFGWRNPTTSTVPKYHTGVDIATVEGTKIKSATDGKVIMASSAGDYGNHYQIQTQDVIIIYAHCKKLYLKEGDMVKQGQEIAEVGSTGNSTGPHLHFEVRKKGRKIDPQLILDL